ncbi:MAG: M48 family metallopeptidase [Candidatus Omnitrophica bacterium]|nr:M48 family metallopeptidase [Candidatus Omnitrophota bacterium]
MTDRTEQARRYAIWKRTLFLLDLLLTTGILAGILAGGWAVALSSWVKSRITGWSFQTAVYGGILWLGMSAFSFPLDWIGSFLLEHRFGLSRLSFPRWLLDVGKRLAVGGVLGLLVLEGLAALIRQAPQGWWAWATLLWLGWTAFLTWVAPAWLIPLFYRQRPLADLKLRGRLEQLLDRAQARVRGIFEVDLSRTTSKANACLCGLGGTRRVLISDTLLATHSPEEVEVVLAHELGHHRLRHLWILIGVGTAAGGLSLFLADQAVRGFGSRLGVEAATDLAALPLIGLVLFLAGLALMPLTHGISRRLEAAADRYALKATGNPRAFISTMRRLGEQNLAEADPPRWVEWLLYDHPPIGKRIALAEEIMHNRGERTVTI